MTRRALVAAGLVALALLLVLFDTPFCPTALLFGVPCPGCGLTRATLALLRLDWRAALHFHPLAPLLAPLFIGAMGKVLVDYVRGPGRALATPGWWTSRTATWLAAVLLALLIGVWVARFLGYLGGPAPVESWRERAAARSVRR